MLFDSHAHFTSSETDIIAQLTRAREAGLTGVLACGGSADLDPGAIAAVHAFPGFAHLAIGYGRDIALSNPSIGALRERVGSLASEGIRVAAIGEIGLDFSRGESFEERAAQIALFRAQLELAAEFALPCTIHSRDAASDTLAILRSLPPEQNRRNVLHCFVGDAKFAEETLALGCSFGISGIVTFASADLLRGIVKTLPRDRLLLETDCPWLAPVPLRGKPNEPAYLAQICKAVAKLWDIAPDECAAITGANAEKLFCKK